MKNSILKKEKHQKYTHHVMLTKETNNIFNTRRYEIRSEAQKHFTSNKFRCSKSLSFSSLQSSAVCSSTNRQSSFNPMFKITQRQKLYKQKVIKR
jgi:hypothetical protein